MKDPSILRIFPPLLLVLLVVLTASTRLLAQHEGHGGSTPTADSAKSSCLQTQTGPYRIEVGTDLAVIPADKAKLRLKITDASGKPVQDTMVKAIAQMPGTNMGESEQVAVPQSCEPGMSVALASFSMAGGTSPPSKSAGRSAKRPAPSIWKQDRTQQR